MHFQRKFNLVSLVLHSIFALACLCLAIVWHSLALILFCGIFIFYAAFSGYRCFCFSDDWYRTKAERDGRWWREHSVLRAAAFIIGVASWICAIVFVIRH